MLQPLIDLENKTSYTFYFGLKYENLVTSKVKFNSIFQPMVFKFSRLKQNNTCDNNLKNLGLFIDIHVCLLV